MNKSLLTQPTVSRPLCSPFKDILGVRTWLIKGGPLVHFTPQMSDTHMHTNITMFW